MLSARSHFQALSSRSGPGCSLRGGRPCLQPRSPRLHLGFISGDLTWQDFEFKTDPCGYESISCNAPKNGWSIFKKIIKQFIMDKTEICDLAKKMHHHNHHNHLQFPNDLILGIIILFSGKTNQKKRHHQPVINPGNHPRFGFYHY